MKGSELRELRNKCGYTQKEVAERLGISYQMYQRYEYKGKRNAGVKPEHYEPLSNLYNLVIDAFQPSAKVKKGKMDGRKLTPKERQALLLREKYDPDETILKTFIEKLLRVKKAYES